MKGLALRIAAMCLFATVAFGEAAALTNLQLDVVINGAPAHMIGAFVLQDEGQLGARRSELEAVGLHLGGGSSADVVWLNTVRGLAYRFDPPNQRVYFTVDDTLRTGHIYDLSAIPPPLAAHSDWGALVNYELNVNGSSLHDFRGYSYNSSALSLDGRLFSPFGVVESTALVRAEPNSPTNALRLDTFVEHIDQDNLNIYRAGDIISNGFAWTRPIRMGGLQIFHDFALRPDIVTTPLPTLGGTAAAPSTVDLFVNGVRTASQDVAAGPFSFVNIPTISGAGTASLVLRDASGAQTIASAPFFVSPDLLRAGKFDWSLEGGAPRVAYGSTADSYVSTPVASASLRGGLWDALTLEGHIEGGSELANGGLGAVVNVFNLGVASVAISASRAQEGAGFQAFGSFETKIGDVTIGASSQRAFGAYDDLAGVTARLSQKLSASDYQAAGVLTPIVGLNPQTLFLSGRPARALENLTFSAPLPFDRRSSASVGIINYVPAYGPPSLIAHASYARDFGPRVAFSATAFHDFGAVKDTGAVFSLNVMLDGGVTASATVSRDEHGREATTSIVKPLGPSAGDLGWRIQDSEGEGAARGAELSARTGFGTVRVGAGRVGSATSGALDARGSIVAAGGGIFASDWIDDSFAVVRTDAPDLKVSSENQVIGQTDSSGRLLIPGLHAYLRNTLDVDSVGLPVDAEMARNRQIVTPSERGGVVVDFKIKRDSDAALVRFLLADGSEAPAGSLGRMADGDIFVLGYGGESFIRGLRKINQATIEWPGRKCRAQFAFTPRPGSQVRIGPVTCA